eukprot:8616942-Pyramimonas_sp.AAC.2
MWGERHAAAQALRLRRLEGGADYAGCDVLPESQIGHAGGGAAAGEVLVASPVGPLQAHAFQQNLLAWTA